MPNVVMIWVWFCAYLNCAGWTLSAMHQLNAGGYALALAIWFVALFVWKQKTSAQIFPRAIGEKFARRFRKPFPLAFLILAVLAFLGGALHPANNYDTLAYRTPRVLHWLDAGHWQWIHTEFQRLNTRTSGFEWLTAPLFALTKTDRLVFLINIACFLLLPGRFFAVLTRLGVRPRAAWYWMWIFPGGYGYVLQAGSVVNDMFGTLMTLTAFEFALRARRDPKTSYLWASILAAALMTAAKAFNILLLLPWAIAALPQFKILLRRPLISCAVILLAASASIVPTALLNVKYCGDWSGLKAEQPEIGGSGKPFRLLANAINLPLVNIAPPIFPFPQQWDHLVECMVPANLSIKLHENMEPGLSDFNIPEMQTEESAGLGAGVTLLVLAVFVKKFRAGKIRPPRFFSVEFLVPLAAWAGVGVFMIQVGAAGPARYLLPFYPLLAAPIIAGAGAGDFFSRRLWRNFALASFAVCALLLILSAPRPLWPAETVLRSLNAENSDNFLLKRAWNVYSAYSLRADGFAPVIAALPPEANPLGFLGFDEPETGLWRPFGSRRIIHFTRDDSPADLRAQGIKFALVSEYTLTHYCQMKPADWLARMDAEPLQHFELKLLAKQEPHGWMLVRFR
jgi:hypothetical protein